MEKCCNPNPEDEVMKGKPDTDEQLDKHVERMRKIKEIEAMQQAISPPKSLTDMLGGPSITSQLGPILSGVSKMISTMPTKTKLEGNINGGNFAIEIVDLQTRDIAISILNNMNFETKKKKA